MLLRRITEHIKAQNWTAVTLDFVIVVVGVFIGIQVSNWNDARAEAAQQQVYLERLHSDFVGIRERLKEHFDVYKDTIEGGDYILRIVRADENALTAIDIDDALMSRAFNGLNSVRIPPPAPATYVEMVSEGQLSGIRNSVLRDKLADYDRLLGVVQEVSRVVANNSVQQAPVLNRYFVTRTVSDPGVLSGVRDELLAFDIEGMRADRDFAIAVTLNQGHAAASLEQRKFQMGFIDEIIALIEQETQ